MNERYKIHFQVDNQALVNARVFFHFQKDPFPGGHQYLLQIEGNRVNKLFDHIKNGVWLNPERRVISECFNYLGDICSDLITVNEELDPLVYLVNSVSEIVKNDNLIIFKGICSERI